MLEIVALRTFAFDVAASPPPDAATAAIPRVVARFLPFSILASLT
jgi:hypothetical protein